MPQANSTRRRAFLGQSFRQMLKADRQRRFRPLRLEQLEGRQMLTLTLSIAVTDGTMTEPPYNNPYDPMDAPDKGSYTITRSGEDMSEPLMVPLWVSVTQVGVLASVRARVEM